MTTELHTGAHAGYRTLDWHDGYDVNLGDLIHQLPQLVRGRYVAIAASDSGPYSLSAIEIASGWQRVGDLAISPIIMDIDQLPTPGFDEWYVFLSACLIGRGSPNSAALSHFNRSERAIRSTSSGHKLKIYNPCMLCLAPVASY
nr:hypothetical protein GCM10020185_31730 [Pseudomonas brassicacearum subsp. brassicacearum]